METIRFYTEVLGMRLTRIVQNRDDPTSTHIFVDMDGGNQLAFFDFSEHGPIRVTPALAACGAGGHNCDVAGLLGLAFID